ncbi:MAG: polyprenyl synthetase family protein [Paracoccaceae bacterium]
MDQAVTDEFRQALAGAKARAEARLESLLPAPDADVPAAMRYAVLGGGKRLRAFLVIEGARLFDVVPSEAEHAAAAVECVHAYSLIHDDLPSMDDDDLRRGLPTVHVKWDEATAILAGDALQSLAFEILSRPGTSPDPAIRLELIRRLAEAAGAAGMVGGQAMDIAAEGAATPLRLPEIEALQARKTGALFRWSAEAGAVLGHADTEPLRVYADALGLAFQIRDDILDVEGDEVKIGKRVGKDADANKATFVSHLGLEGARRRALQLSAAACDALAPFGAAAGTLRQAAEFTITRTA